MVSFWLSMGLCQTQFGRLSDSDVASFWLSLDHFLTQFEPLSNSVWASFWISCGLFLTQYGPLSDSVWVSFWLCTHAYARCEYWCCDLLHRQFADPLVRSNTLSRSRQRLISHQFHGIIYLSAHADFETHIPWLNFVYQMLTNIHNVRSKPNRTHNIPYWHLHVDRMRVVVSSM